MRDLNGVTLLSLGFLRNLKPLSLLFDTFYVYGLDSIPYHDQIPDSVKADVEFLQQKGIIKELPLKVWIEVGKEAHASEDYKKMVTLFDNAKVNAHNVGLEDDFWARLASTKLAAAHGMITAPICHFDFPADLFGTKIQPNEAAKENMLRVGLNALPAPDDTCSWEEILAFRAEMGDKLWGYRRFLHSLSTKKQSEAEIRDDIEWTLNEYSKAMEIHRVKSSQSAVDAFVITPLEILEDLIQLKWSKLAKGFLSVEKRRVELIEAEMTAPGKECAYIFDTKRKFESRDSRQNRGLQRDFIPLVKSWPFT